MAEPARSSSLSYIKIIAIIVGIGSIIINSLSPIEPVSFNVPDLIQYTANNDLSASEHLFEGELPAPEDIAVSKDGDMYLSLGDGRIVVVKKDRKTWKLFARTGKDNPTCRTRKPNTECGRPLGLKFAKAIHFEKYLSANKKDVDEVLIVSDAYRGLLLIENDGKIVTLAKQVNGRRLHLLNGLDIAKDGTIYFTESSRKFPWSRIFYELLEARGTGSLLAFHPTNQTTATVTSDLPFPNGILLASDGDSALICLSTRFRIIRYYLRGPKKGQTDVFAQLPGIPDNLSVKYVEQWDKRVYFVALAAKYTWDAALLMKYKGLRKLVAAIVPYRFISHLVTTHGIVVALDEDGTTLKVFEDSSPPYP